MRLKTVGTKFSSHFAEQDQCQSCSSNSEIIIQAFWRREIYRLPRWSLNNYSMKNSISEHECSVFGSVQLPSRRHYSVSGFNRLKVSVSNKKILFRLYFWWIWIRIWINIRIRGVSWTRQWYIFRSSYSHISFIVNYNFDGYWMMVFSIDF